MGKDFCSLWIEDDGALIYTCYQDRIVEDKRGPFSSERFDALVRFIEDRGFFSLKDHYPSPDQPNVLYEHATYMVTVALDLHSHKTITADEHAMPRALKEIVNELLSLARGFPDSRLYGSFIVVRVMDKQYFIGEELWKTEVELLKDQGVKFHRFTGETASDYPELWEVLSRPGKFVHLDDEVAARLKRLSSDGRKFYLVFEGKNYEASFYTRKEEQP